MPDIMIQDVILDVILNQLMANDPAKQLIKLSTHSNTALKPKYKLALNPLKDLQVPNITKPTFQRGLQY